MDQNRRKKQVVLGTVWTVAIILAAALLLHNNVLEDPDTARLKKISGCLFSVKFLKRHEVVIDAVCFACARCTGGVGHGHF